MSNLNPVNVEILLRETVSKGLEAAVSAVKELDTGVKQGTASMATKIKEQQQLIKEITGDIKNLAAAAKDATDPNKKAEILGDLKGARRALAEEQATLIGMQRQQIAGNTAEAGSQVGLLAGLGKWAIGLASVGAAMEVGKKIIESTEATAHAYEQVMTAASSATSYLFQTIASGDWSNFTDGISTAVKGAIEYVNAMEEVNNLANQDKILSATYDKKIAEAREKTYDKGSDNNSERKAGYQEMISLNEQKFSGLIETQVKKTEALLGKASSDTGGKTSAAEIEQFISGYRSLEAMIEEGEKYNKLKSLKLKAPLQSHGYQSGGNKAEYDQAQEEIKAMGEAGRIAGEKAFNISKIIFPVRNELAASLAKTIELEAQKQQGNAFTKRSLGSLENKIETEAKALAKKKKEDAELDNRIKATAELLRLAGDAERDDLAKKLVMLEAEKKLIEWKNNAAKAIVENKPMESKGADTALGALRAMGMAAGINLDKPGAISDNSLEYAKIKKGNDARAKKAKELTTGIAKDTKEADKEAEGFRNKMFDIADAASILADALAGSNSELSAMLGSMAGLAGGFAQIASGNPAAMIQGAVSVLKSLQTLAGDGGAGDRAKSIERVNTLLEKQQSIIEETARTGGEQTERQKELDLLNEKLATIEKNKAQAQHDLDKQKSEWYNLASVLFGNKGKLKEEIAQAEKDIEATKELIVQAEQDLLDFNAQGQTQNVLADAIAQAFQDGKGSVKDFGEYTNQILRDAVLSAFKANILGDTLTNAQKQIAAAFEDGKLSKEEISGIKTSMQQATDSAKGQWDALTSSFPEMFGTSADSGMTASIKSITEETATALGGNITAIRLNMARLIDSNTNSMGMLQQSLEYQLRTADNTEAMNKMLGNIDSRLGRFENDGIKVK